MLTQIDLRLFKCFSLLKLPLSPLTLLSGVNASGKSSVIQALGLLHQTVREHEWSNRLMLNGGTLQLGTTEDLIDKVHGRRQCEIGLVDGEKTYRWKFTGEREEMAMEVTSVSVDDIEQSNQSPLRRLLPSPHGDGPLAQRLWGLTYLTAERLGPRETYSLEEPQVSPVIGPFGEHTVSVLYSGRDERVLEGLMINDEPNIRLRQVQARLGCFFPGCELIIAPVPRVNAVTLGIRTSKDTDFHRPVHTGFGITQVLPIVVAALSARREDLLLIENPEVHLHPAGQATMGEFLSQVAAAEVQVIVETHSDHVLNGIRRAVKNRVIDHDDAVLHFFRPRQVAERDGVDQVQSPCLDREGNIEDWPEGFFDQFDKDMNYFAGWG